MSKEIFSSDVERIIAMAVAKLIDELATVKARLDALEKIPTEYDEGDVERDPMDLMSDATEVMYRQRDGK